MLTRPSILPQKTDISIELPKPTTVDEVEAHNRAVRRRSGDVSENRNGKFTLAMPFAVEGPITIATAGGSHQFPGVPFNDPPFVELSGVEATPDAGVPVDSNMPAANTGQTITLVGRGFTDDTLVQFDAVDSEGVAGTVSRTGTVSDEGTRLTVVVPALAQTGTVTVVGTNATVPIQIVPTLRSVGGAIADGNQVILEGTGLVEGDLAISIDGQAVTSHDVTAWVDGNDPLPNNNDDGAIATNKLALLPGETTTFANYTSYVHGINGLMIDIAGLASPGTLSTTDFEFRVGNSPNTAAWPTLTVAPSIDVRPASGIGDSDRVTLIWPNGTIVNEWLQVTVLATPNSGLLANDVFYFGNAIGETGNSALNTFIDAFDFASVRDNPKGMGDPATITNARDINRDRLVDGTDLAIVRDNQTNFITALLRLETNIAPPPVLVGLQRVERDETRTSEEGGDNSFPTILLSTPRRDLDQTFDRMRDRANADDTLRHFNEDDWNMLLAELTFDFANSEDQTVFGGSE